MRIAGLLLLSVSISAACGPSCPQGTVMRGEGCVRADDVVSDRVEVDARDTGVVDRDGTMDDGSIDAGSGDGRVCASSDSLDELGVDENCDGADGVARETVFVSTSGMSGATGTATSPVQTLLEASRIAASNPMIRTVLISRGAMYSAEGLDALLARGVRVYGSYTFTRNPLPTDYPNWTRPLGEFSRMPTVIELPGRGTRVAGGTDAALGYIALRTPPTTATSPTSIGLILDGARGFVFDHATVSANSGLAGVNGQNGATTVDDATLRSGGAAMNEIAGLGAARIACATSSGGDAGADAAVGDASASVGIAASVGGAGGRGTQGSTLAQPGAAGGGGAAGGQVLVSPDGVAGASGRVGAGGAGASTPPTFDRARGVFAVALPERGAWGEMGQGGGGGAGGYRLSGSCTSGGGGGGGAGGCGGAPGEAGSNGGHSIAVVAIGEVPRFIASELFAGAGGAGGRGGEGAEGGGGGVGGAGHVPTNASCLPGGRGGSGGRGGGGGGGGGGAGGWSVGVLAVGAALGTTPSGVTIRVGTRGAAGEGGRPSGTAGIEGDARQTMQVP
ncbi:MAG: hypothetical protein JNK05_24700 [Myxococcales bacterium]|nr:hypothetical protein [Myxococcales bacterium]